jgi:hypothetical protein
MKPLTVVVPYRQDSPFRTTALSLINSDLVERMVVVSQESVHLEMDRSPTFVAQSLSSGETLNRILSQIQTKYLLVLSRQLNSFPWNRTSCRDTSRLLSGLMPVWSTQTFTRELDMARPTVLSFLSTRECSR